MTTDRKPDADEPTVEIREVLLDDELQDVDPERTLVREDWNGKGARRAAPPKKS
jgi:hypothetical protein